MPIWPRAINYHPKEFNMNARRILILTVFAALVAALPSVAFGQIVTVTCTGTPSTDGAALLTAYSGATGSSTAPVVVQPDPCLYDIGTSTLTAKNFVDLIGLGRNDTIITSQVDFSTLANSGTITVPASVDAEFANLTIRNTANECYVVRNASDLFVMDSVILEAECAEDAVGLFTVGAARLNDGVIRADANGEEVDGRAVGIEDDGGDAVVTDTLITFEGSSCTNGFGAIVDAADSVFIGVNVFGSPCTNSTGFEIGDGSSPTINNSTATVTGSVSARGIDTTGFFGSILARVNDTNLIASGGSGTTYGVRVLRNNHVVAMTNVTAFALNGSTRVGLQVTAGLATADRSTFDGTSSLVVNSGATARIGVSKLQGTRTTTGTATCVGAYDGAYAAIPTTC